MKHPILVFPVANLHTLQSPTPRGDFMVPMADIDNASATQVRLCNR